MDHALYEQSVARDGWDEVFLTFFPLGPVTDPGDMADFYNEAAAYIAEQGYAILLEKVYGPSEHMEAGLSGRRDAYASHGLGDDLPATWIDGQPCIGGVLAGVQILAALPRDDGVSCRTLATPEGGFGRVLETPAYRRAYLSGVSGLDPDGEGNVSAQGERMFRRAKAQLEAEGFEATDIVRTWIYLARLLDWYGEFNAVRTRCYAEFGLMPEDENILPASTGIQCKRLDGEECFMDVLAIRRTDGTRTGITQMKNTRQNEAYEYGSSFCRGMAVTDGKEATLFISGTASINPEGATVYHGDHQAQILETFLDVNALLSTEGAHIRDIVQATAYCKDEEDYRMLCRMVDFLDREDLPLICVYADVCRDELLYEMDAVAIAPDPESEPGSM